MKIITSLTKSIKKGMETEHRILTRGIRFGVKETASALKNSLRKQVRNAGMTRRFSRSWRVKHYKNDSINPASLVYSKAPEIIHSFDKGLLIRAKNTDWLAIPTKFAPKKFGKFRATPARLTKASRIKFRFVQTSESTAVLIAKSASKRRKKPVVMFVLVKQVQMPKKFDVDRSVKKWVGKAPELIERELAKQIAKAKR